MKWLYVTFIKAIFGILDTSNCKKNQQMREMTKFRLTGGH